MGREITATLNGLLKWIPARDGWHLYNADNGEFVNEFYGCGIMLQFFPDASREEDNYYYLTCTKTTKQEASNG